MSHNRIQRVFNQRIELADVAKYYKREHTLGEILEEGDLAQQQATESYRKYKLKKEEMSYFVQFYLYIRRRSVNPIQLETDKRIISRMVNELHGGAIELRSSIERALINDLRTELLTGRETNECYAAEVKFWRMIARYLELLRSVVVTNMDKISYLSMLLVAILQPGVLSLIYPFAVFGYALFEETRPGSKFWYMMLGYTQVLTVVEFALSLNFWYEFQGEFFLKLVNVLEKYYSGLQVAQGHGIASLLSHFAPKILVLFCVTSYIQQEKMVDLFDQKEMQKESV